MFSGNTAAGGTGVLGGTGDPGTSAVSTGTWCQNAITGTYHGHHQRLIYQGCVAWLARTELTCETLPALLDCYENSNPWCMQVDPTLG
jgi:hypothetical protein